MQSFFPSKYPIIALPMNGVSDVEFAIKCHDIGIMPSLFIRYKEIDKEIDLSILEDSVLKFKNYTGHTNLILAVDPTHLLNINFFKLLVKLNIGFISLTRIGNSHTLRLSNDDINNDINIELKRFKEITNTKILANIINSKFSSTYNSFINDGIIIKGNDGAGRIKLNKNDPELTTKEIFDIIDKTSNIIPSGGIGSSEQVKYYFENGATAIGIGTLFAASKESKLSTETKLLMCKSTTKDLYRMPDSQRNSLIIGKLEEVMKEKENRNNSLDLGVSTGTHGHIYCGHGINYITEIKSLKTIVDELMSWKLQ